MHLIVICPRPCPSPRTDHCCGPAINGRARCWHCGRFMPMDEVVELITDTTYQEVPTPCETTGTPSQP